MDIDPQKSRQKILQAIQVAETNDVHIPTPGQRGAVVGVLNRICGGDENRHLLMGWLFSQSEDFFSVKSAKDLSNAQWSALYGWCDFRKDEERNVRLPRPDFVQECLACLTMAIRMYHRIRLKDRAGLPTPPELVGVATTLGGEITELDGNKMVGVKVKDEVFIREKPLALPPSPPPESAPKDRPALREPFKSKPPKLINPF